MVQRYDIRPQILPEQPTAVAEATLAVPEIGPWLTKTYNDIAAVLDHLRKHNARHHTAIEEFSGDSAIFAGTPGACTRPARPKR